MARPYRNLSFVADIPGMASADGLIDLVAHIVTTINGGYLKKSLLFSASRDRYVYLYVRKQGGDFFGLQNIYLLLFACFEVASF